MADEQNLPFHRKYRPNTIKKYIGNEKIKETAMRTLASGKKPQVVLLYGDSGCGKAQPLDSLVLTTSGYKKMGDIKVGDEVFTHKGNRGIISGVYPQGIRPIYKISLSDLTYIYVSDEHLNCINMDGIPCVITTKELVNLYNTGNFKFSIDATEVNWESNDTVFNPYLLGYILGSDDEAIGELDKEYRNIKREIPNEYLYNTKEVRVNLLQGLIDTIQNTDTDGYIEFTTEYKKLSDDIAFLVRSLGVIDTVTEGDRYTHRMIIPKSLNMELGSFIYSQSREKRIITSVERVEDKECQCIMVDHEDHTYISDFFIPTHNTTFARLLAKEYSCENRDLTNGACNCCDSCQNINEYITTGNTDILTNIQEIDITDQSGKRDLNAVFEDMAIPSFDGQWKIYIFDECHKASEALQNRLLKITEEPPENVLMVFCTTNPEKMLDTLRNRCQLELQVKKPKVKELAGLLKYVCETEGVDYNNQGLEFIANRSELTIRTALQNLQQVVNEQNSAEYDSVVKVFEEVSGKLIIDFFRVLKNKDTLRYITMLYDIKSRMDLLVFINSLRDFVKRGIYTINGISQDGIALKELDIYRDLFASLSIDQICGLLEKLTSLNTSNLEMELISWGYTGLATSHHKEAEEPQVVEIQNEIAEEKKVTNEVIKIKEEEQKAIGISNATKQLEAVTIEDLLSIGGSFLE